MVLQRESHRRLEALLPIQLDTIHTNAVSLVDAAFWKMIRMTTPAHDSQGFRYDLMKRERSQCHVLNGNMAIPVHTVQSDVDSFIASMARMGTCSKSQRGRERYRRSTGIHQRRAGFGSVTAIARSLQSSVYMLIETQAIFLLVMVKRYPLILVYSLEARRPEKSQVGARTLTLFFP